MDYQKCLSLIWLSILIDLVCSTIPIFMIIVQMITNYKYIRLLTVLHLYYLYTNTVLYFIDIFIFFSLSCRNSEYLAFFLVL